MSSRRWLWILGSLLFLLAVLVFGWLGVSLVDKRQSDFSDAVTAQTLKLAPLAENDRIFAGLVFSELQWALTTSASATGLGVEKVRQAADFYEYSLASGGNLVGLGSFETDTSFATLKRVLRWLHERNQSFLGRSWSGRVERTYFVSSDQHHALSVPAWLPTTEAFRALVQSTILPFPGDPKKGTGQVFFSNPRIDPVDRLARLTLVSPIFGADGTWLGNAAVDFVLDQLAKVLSSASLVPAQWLLVDQNHAVLASNVVPDGDFRGLTPGVNLVRSALSLPPQTEGLNVTTGAYTVQVSRVPGSTLFVYALLRTDWLYQDLTLLGGVGGFILLFLVGALALIGLLQARNDEKTRVLNLTTQAQLSADRERRDREAGIKDFLAGVSSRFHQASDLSAYAQLVLQAARDKTGAEYGAFYVLEGARALVPFGAHGVALTELKKEVLGQGLVGECAKARRSVRVLGSEAARFRVVWGQGSLSPVLVDLVPVVRAEKLFGVLVLAFLQKPSVEPQEFYEAFVPVVSGSFEIFTRNLSTAAQAKSLERQQSILMETEAWTQKIIESAPAGMIVADAQGTVVMSNEHAEQLFGYASGELIGQSIETLVPEAIRPHHRDLRDGFLESGTLRAKMGTGARIVEAQKKTGSTLRVEIVLTRLPPLADSGVCVCAWVQASTG